MKLVAAVLFCAFSSSAYPQGVTSKSDLNGKATFLSEIDKIDESIAIVRHPEAPHDVIGVGVYTLHSIIAVSQSIVEKLEALTLEFKVPHRVVSASFMRDCGIHDYFQIIEGQNFNDEEAVKAPLFIRNQQPYPATGTTVSWNENGIVVTKDRSLTKEKSGLSVPTLGVPQKIGDLLFIGVGYFGICTRLTAEGAFYYPFDSNMQA